MKSVISRIFYVYLFLAQDEEKCKNQLEDTNVDLMDKLLRLVNADNSDNVYCADALKIDGAWTGKVVGEISISVILIIQVLLNI